MAPLHQSPYHHLHHHVNRCQVQSCASAQLLGTFSGCHANHCQGCSVTMSAVAKQGRGREGLPLQGIPLQRPDAEAIWGVQCQPEELQALRQDLCRTHTAPLLIRISGSSIAANCFRGWGGGAQAKWAQRQARAMLCLPLSLQCFGTEDSLPAHHLQSEGPAGAVGALLTASLWGPSRCRPSLAKLPLGWPCPAPPPMHQQKGLVPAPCVPPNK